jgi:hypothetical protein
MRVTVAAQAQKQVAMLVQPSSSYERVYLLDAGESYASGGSVQPAPSELRGHNVGTQGLGVPLSAGAVALFARGAGRELFASEAPIGDLAVGEKGHSALRGKLGRDLDAHTRRAKPEARAVADRCQQQAERNGQSRAYAAA